MVTNTAKLQEKIMALTNIDGSGGVDILTRSGDFKSTYDILLEISKVWKDMGDVEQAALLELVAGKTRGSVVAALFQNGDVLEKAYKSATDASGSAMRELNNHLDSIQGRVDLFNNSLQTMWMNFIDDDVVKRIVDLGTALMRAIDFVNPLNVAIAGLFGGMFAKYKMKQNNTDILSLLFETAPAKIKNSPTIQNIVSTVKDAFNESMGRSIGTVNSFDMLAELANFDDAQIHLGDLANIFGDKDVTRKQAKQILDSFDDISDATKEAILSSNLFAVSQTGAAAGTNILTASLVKAKAAAIAFGKGLMAFAVAHPIIAGLTAAVIAFGAAWAIVDAVTTSHDEYIEKLETETEALKSVQTELQTVQDELDATKAHMDELEAKGPLSFVEEEEYNRLQKVTAELERQEEILLAQEKRARNKQIETALNAVKTDPNESDNIDVKSSMLNGMYYAASQQHDLYVPGNPYAAGLQEPKISNEDKYQSIINSLKEAKAELEVAEKELSTTDFESKEYDAAEKKVQKAKERVDKFNDAIESMNDTWNAEYGEIGYVENATTEAEKQWNEYYRQHQDFVDQWMLLNDSYANGKATVLDRVFGETGTDIAQEFKKEFESAINSGKDPSEVIESLFANEDYSNAFSGLEKQFGITIDNIKSYFTQTGEFAIDPEFDIAKYSHDIKSHSAVISEFQEALKSLEKGTFTMDDFLDLIERFPDLAKGVDISSNAFYGLSRNLNKAIKTRTKSFVNDLKELKKSLEAAGKETESVEQLITAIENMPEDALDNIIERYSTLADEIEKAKVAQDRLKASMEENPNEGYETRGEALEYMKDAMSKGEIGSESNLWNVAKEYGFTKETAKLIDAEADSLNDYADALAKYIASREKFFTQADDGDDRTDDGYSYKGAINFIKTVEGIVDESEKAGSRLSEILKWTYDETTGAFDFKFDNQNLPEIISLLSQTEQLVGINNAEWMDLMVQVGQFFNIEWGNAKDISDYITAIAEGSGTAADKIDQMTDSVETYVEKALGTDLDFSSLTQASIDVLDCDDSIKQLLKTYLSLKQSLEDPLHIEATIGNSESVAPLLQIKELKDSIVQGDNGYNFVNTDTFTAVLKEAGYTEEKIQSLIKKIQEYQSVITITNDDPLGLNSQNSNITSVISSLNILGVEYETVKGELNQPIGINITSNDLITALKEKGWEPTQIAAYLQTLTSAENGLNITVDGKVTMNKEEIDAAIAAANEVPEEEKTEYTITGTGVSTLSGILSDWDLAVIPKSTDYTINETTVKKTVTENSGGLLNKLFGRNSADGTAHVQGTAYNSGSWGASQTETSLVGELGPELLVRGNRWTTVGENGAEFTQVKKGDIIFNHKQTKSLLENGYVTSRGRAYASGTAYASGGGTFNRYEFSGSGGYTKYDVNNNVVDQFGNAAGAMSGAASDISDAADEFREVFDWIEVRLEEINEDIDLRSAKLDNTVGSDKQNVIVEDMIELNEKLYDNLLAGSDRYYSYAKTLLAKIPSQYREAVQNGAIAIEEFIGEVDEKTLEAIQEYRDWVQKGADATQQAEETLTEISSLAKQAIDNISDDYGNKNSIRDSEIEQLEAYNSLTAAKYGAESANIYKEIIKETNNNIKTLEEQRNKMQAELNKQVQAGNIKKYSQDWYDVVNDIAAVDTEIINLTADTYDYQDSINELHWDAFDNLMSRLEAISDEASNIVDILGNKDLVDDDGNWTDEGITSLGLYAQQMENAEVQSKKYREEIDYLNKNWESLGFTEQEYAEKLEELTSNQYDAIKSYHDAKKAIKDLTAERVEAIKKGIEKEVEAYEELINKKKEALDAEKESFDFQRNIEESTKEISKIERQIAALSADQSASARAKRAQLQADLAKAQQELQDKYYEQSIQDQQDALDKELEHFQEEKDKEIEGWDKYLENTEQVVTDGLATVQGNTELVYQTLQNMGQEYSLLMSDALTSPWEDGESAIQSYAEKFGLAMSSTVKELQDMADECEKLMSDTENYGKQSVDKVNSNIKNYQDATKTPTTTTTTEEPKTVKVGGKINAGNAKIYEYAGDTAGASQYYANDPIYKVLKIDGDWVQVRHHKLSTGVTGWFRKSQVKAYAKGTYGVEDDQLALLHELGDELVLSAGANGKLQYITKGTAVIPHDISENLVKLGQLDPQNILDQNRPVISAPHITNNNVELNVTFGEVVHIDHVDNAAVPNLAKTVEKQIDRYMKGLNSEIRKYVR